jgi:hypothetical protein
VGGLAHPPNNMALIKISPAKTNSFRFMVPPEYRNNDVFSKYNFLKNEAASKPA